MSTIKLLSDSAAYPALTGAGSATGDLLLVYDISAAAYKSMTRAELVEALNAGGLAKLANPTFTGLIKIDGATSSQGALRQSAANVEAVLADGSAYTKMVAGSFSAAYGATQWALDSSLEAQTIANGGTFSLPAGAGLVCLTQNGAGEVALFMVGGGTVTLIAQTAAIFVAGVPGAGKIGLKWNGATAYLIDNNTGSSQLVGIGGIRPRLGV